MSGLIHQDFRVQRDPGKPKRPWLVVGVGGYEVTKRKRGGGHMPVYYASQEAAQKAADRMNSKNAGAAAVSTDTLPPNVIAAEGKAPFTDPIALLRELRAAQDAETVACVHYRNARGNAKEAAYDTLYAATKRRHAAEERADLFLEPLAPGWAPAQDGGG